MIIDDLQKCVNEFKFDLEEAISTSTFNGKVYDNGQKAKEALIRSQKLIMLLHEVVKKSLSDRLTRDNKEFTLYPPLNSSAPELKISGFIKAKQQDVVVLFGKDTPVKEKIEGGPLHGYYDAVGYQQTKRSIIIGVRSQMSSIDKNFDTLMERAFAETLNLRLKFPDLVIGEVYLLPVVEYDDKSMIENKVSWKNKNVKIEKFIRTFLSFSDRAGKNTEDLYKYDRSILLLVDFREKIPKIYKNIEELRKDGFVSESFEFDFTTLSPNGFCEDLIKSYKSRHGY